QPFHSPLAVLPRHPPRSRSAYSPAAPPAVRSAASMSQSPLRLRHCMPANAAASTTGSPPTAPKRLSSLPPGIGRRCHISTPVVAPGPRIDTPARSEPPRQLPREEAAKPTGSRWLSPVPPTGTGRVHPLAAVIHLP